MRRYIHLLFLLLAGYSASALELPKDQDILTPSVIQVERGARSMVKSAARDFSRNYADYYASFLIVRTIKSGGRYREVQGAAGVFASLGFNQKTNTRLYWDDKNAMGRLFVCDTFVSEYLFPDRNAANPVLRVVSKDVPSGEDALKVNYVSNFDVSALDRKRAVEIFSPLNPKMIDSYTYKKSGIAKVGGKEVRVIDFSSKSEAVSQKERILCSGQLFIDSDGRVRKIVVENMDDRFTRYVRNFSGMSLATPYTYTITYGEKNGRIYTSGIRQDLSWKRPDGAAGEMYSAEWNPVRNPFKNRVETSFVMTFSDPKIVKSGGKYGASAPADRILCYNTSRDYGFWKRILSKEIDLEQFLKDTGATWDALCGQTQTRQERELVTLCVSDSEVSAEKERLTVRTSKAREMFRTLYKKDYTDGF